MSRFEKLSLRDGEYVTDSASGQRVLHVTDPHAFTQAAGYLKYVGSEQNTTAVYYRGQQRLYPALSPTLFRGRRKPADKRIGKLNDYLGRMRSETRVLAAVPDDCHEPLLQHYGIKTTWLDLVDNIWVALWFACHEARTAGPLGQYLHFERRESNASPSDNAQYAYVLLISVELNRRREDCPGLIVGKMTEVVDLRMAVPSTFLRPHAQHGVLARLRGNTKTRPLDYSAMTAGVIRVGLADALRWLGDSPLLDAHYLFPPPFYDHGYRDLLDHGLSGNRVVGHVAHVGA